jgi:DNA-binding LacI/PurR family transcriptional regulator
MPVSIYHVGLPFNHPIIPVDDRPEIMARVRGLQERMRAAGYSYEVIHVSPDEGLAEFRRRLRTGPCDGVLIGGGLIGNQDLSYFLEQVINTTHEAAPQAKIMFFNHAEDVRTIVGRWFQPSLFRP